MRGFRYLDKNTRDKKQLKAASIPASEWKGNLFELAIILLIICPPIYRSLVIHKAVLTVHHAPYNATAIIPRQTTTHRPQCS